MKVATERELLKLLDALIEVEIQLARYYHVMTYFSPEHSDIWKKLSGQEAAHARSLEKIHRAVEEQPEKFTPGKFTATAARMVVDEVDDMRKKVLCEEVTPQLAISFIRDIEDSVFECYAAKVVRTEVAEVNEILETMKAETAQHRRILKELTEG